MNLCREVQFKEPHSAIVNDISDTEDENNISVNLSSGLESEYPKSYPYSLGDKQNAPRHFKTQRVPTYKRTRSYKKELEEFNNGIELTNLKNPDEWVRLRKFLNENKVEMEQYVANGTTPLVGFPTVLYDQHKQNGGVANIKKALTDHVIPKNEHFHTVSKLITAVENEQEREEKLLIKFSKGMKVSEELPAYETRSQS